MLESGLNDEGSSVRQLLQRPDLQQHTGIPHNNARSRGRSSVHPFKCRHARQHRHHIFAQGPARGSFIILQKPRSSKSMPTMRAVTAYYSTTSTTSTTSTPSTTSTTRAGP